MDPIGELYAEHRLLEMHSARLLRIVAGEVPDPASIAAHRWGMARILADHCLREDEEVYAVLIASGDPVAAAAAAEDREAHGKLGSMFLHYIGEWPVTRVAREWEAFRAASHRMVAALAERIAREESGLYPLAEALTLRRAA